MPQQGYKTKLWISANDDTYAAEVAGSNGWTQLETLDQITPPAPDAAVVDDTHFDSTNQFDENSPGFAAPGTVAFRVQYSPERLAQIAGLFRQKKGFKVQFGDNTTDGVAGTHNGGVGFDGWLKTYNPPPELRGNTYITGTIQVSGPPVVIAADTTP